MKLTRLYFVCLMFIGLACDDKNEKDQSAAAARIVEVENRAINGQQWRITNYTESNVDQTASFNGYIFEFDSNNLLTVTNGSDNVAGTWSVVAAKSDDDDSESEFNDIDFNLMFTNPEMFAELTEDWEILSISDTKIELRHSRDNGRLDLLTFERI